MTLPSIIDGIAGTQNAIYQIPEDGHAMGSCSSNPKNAIQYKSMVRYQSTAIGTFKHKNGSIKRPLLIQNSSTNYRYPPQKVILNHC
jgi:hypothetical protein